MLQGIALSRLSNKVEKSIIERRALAIKHKENAIRDALLRPGYERLPPGVRANQSIHLQQPTNPPYPGHMPRRPYPQPAQPQYMARASVAGRNPGVMQPGRVNPEAVRSSQLGQSFRAPLNARPSAQQTGNSARSSVAHHNADSMRLRSSNQGTVRSSIAAPQPRPYPNYSAAQRRRVIQSGARPSQESSMAYPMTGQSAARPVQGVYQNAPSVRSSQPRTLAPIQHYGMGVNQQAMSHQMAMQPRPIRPTQMQTQNRGPTPSDATENEDSEDDEDSAPEPPAKQEPVQSSTASHQPMQVQLSQQRPPGTIPVLNKNDGKIYYIPVEKMMAARLMSQNQ